MQDRRVYVLSAGVAVAIQSDDAQLNCHRGVEGQEGFHRIAVGEVHLLDDEGRAYCLNCSLALELATINRPVLGARRKPADGPAAD